MTNRSKSVFYPSQNRTMENGIWNDLKEKLYIIIIYLSVEQQEPLATFKADKNKKKDVYVYSKVP